MTTFSIIAFSTFSIIAIAFIFVVLAALCAMLFWWLNSIGEWLRKITRR